MRSVWQLLGCICVLVFSQLAASSAVEHLLEVAATRAPSQSQLALPNSSISHLSEAGNQMCTQSSFSHGCHLKEDVALDEESTPYATAELRKCNDLTRLSPVPGFLDYEAYVRYLSLLGHVKAPQKFGVDISTEPQRSALEVVEEDSGLAQEDAGTTSWRADQALWTEDNLPHILYAFDRPKEWLAAKDLKDPPLKGYEINGFTLRDIPVLPDHISAELEGWRHVAWTRLDPRISSKDILDRTKVNYLSGEGACSDRRTAESQNSTIQMRTARFREDFPALGWVKKGGNFEKDKRKLKARLKAAGVPLSANTTRGVSWGLLHVDMGEKGGRICVPETKSWASSVGRQPEVLPDLPTSLPEHPHLLLNHSRRIPRSDFSMSFSSSVDNLLRSCAKFSTMGSHVASPSKRQKTIDFQDDRLASISEVSVQTSSTNKSHKDPYQLAYNRGIELRNRFCDPDQKKNQRDIPDDLLMSSSPDGSVTNNGDSTVFSEDTLPRKLRRLTTELRTKLSTTGPLLQIEPTPQESDAPLTIEHGSRTLTLKTSQERQNPSKEDRRLLATFYPAGSEQRDRQLEYLLDPTCARQGFQDCNGYDSPVGGVNLRELGRTIWYEGALGHVNTQARVSTMDDDPYFVTPGVVAFVNGTICMVDDLEKVPRDLLGEVKRARRIIN